MTGTLKALALPSAADRGGLGTTHFPAQV